jgi:hypothetical protein
METETVKQVQQGQQVEEKKVGEENWIEGENDENEDIPMEKLEEFRKEIQFETINEDPVVLTFTLLPSNWNKTLSIIYM